MRTTVTLEPDVAAQLKAFARRRNISFKAALNSAVRAGLEAERGGRRPYQMPTRPMGLRPEVDLTHALRLADALEDAEIVDVKMVECGKLRGTIQAIVDATAWVIEDARRHNRPAVANWSFIADTAAHIAALDSAVAALRAEGIPVIVSVGAASSLAVKVADAFGVCLASFVRGDRMVVLTHPDRLY